MSMENKTCKWCGKDADLHSNDVLVNIGDKTFHLECIGEAEETLMPRMLMKLDCETCGKGTF